MRIARSTSLRDYCSRLSPRIAFLFVLLFALHPAIAAEPSALERIKQTGQIRLGYMPNLRPFTYRLEEGSQPQGYMIELCNRVVESLKAQQQIGSLRTEWVPVTLAGRFQDVRGGRIDLLCSPSSVTPEARQEVSFSTAVFPAGVRAVLRSDAPEALRNALAEEPTQRVVWRGSPAAKLLEKTSFATVSGTVTEKWLARRLTTFQVDAKTVSVPSYREGLQQVVNRNVSVFFGERSLVYSTLEGMDPKVRQNLMIIERLFTREPVAIALPRSDEDLRLAVDVALSEIYKSENFGQLYSNYFGTYDANAQAFFQWNTLVQ